MMGFQGRNRIGFFVLFAIGVFRVINIRSAGGRCLSHTKARSVGS